LNAKDAFGLFGNNLIHRLPPVRLALRRNAADSLGEFGRSVVIAANEARHGGRGGVPSHRMLSGALRLAKAQGVTHSFLFGLQIGQ
jgi:hypothetical protein